MAKIEKGEIGVEGICESGQRKTFECTQTKINRIKKIRWEEVDENIWDPLLDDEEEDEF